MDGRTSCCHAAGWYVKIEQGLGTVEVGPLPLFIFVDMLDVMLLGNDAGYDLTLGAVEHNSHT